MLGSLTAASVIYKGHNQSELCRQNDVIFQAFKLINFSDYHVKLTAPRKQHGIFHVDWN